MQLIQNLADLSQNLRGAALSIGNFDGVHLGHASIIRRLTQKAVEVGGESIVFTFDPHPVRLLRPELAPPPLTWTDRKSALLAKLGVTAMIAYPTDQALLNLEPQAFFEKVVLQTIDAKAIVEGPNFYFGKDRAGNTETLKKLAAKHQIQVDVVAASIDGDELVSSSRIRSLISAGKIVDANRMLTCRYRIRGMVTHGAGRGASLGFATANIEAIDTLIPALGVYAARAYVSETYIPELNNQEQPSSWPAAVNIGPSPTFGESAIKVEAHLIGFDQSIYGKVIELDFYRRLRETQPFNNVDDLTAQLQKDVQQTLEITEQE